MGLRRTRRNQRTKSTWAKKKICNDKTIGTYYSGTNQISILFYGEGSVIQRNLPDHHKYCSPSLRRRTSARGYRADGYGGYRITLGTITLIGLPGKIRVLRSVEFETRGWDPNGIRLPYNPPRMFDLMEVDQSREGLDTIMRLIEKVYLSIKGTPRRNQIQAVYLTLLRFFQSAGHRSLLDFNRTYNRDLPRTDLYVHEESSTSKPRDKRYPTPEYNLSRSGPVRPSLIEPW